VLFVLLASFANAQTNAGYFTETTAPSDNVQTGQTAYTYGVTAATLAADSTYYIYTQPFGSSATKIRNSFMGSKVLVGINITVAFEDVAATLILQVSFDGTNWYDLSTLDSDTTPNVTGVQTFLADFSSTYAPYARLIFNEGGLDVGEAGTIKFMYAIPN
jgi:hypothetical protein